MATLLQNYSLSDIFLFMVLLALAIKSLITFYDWSYERLKKIFDKQYTGTTAKKELEERLQKGSQIMDQLRANQQQTDTILADLQKKIDMLIDSDRDDIKSFITREHHYFCYKIGWIDDFSLQCIEKRYKHYKDEGGNSFIQGFMDDLRNLPKLSPNNDKDQDNKIRIVPPMN